jgi:stage V sporulation protein AD
VVEGTIGRVVDLGIDDESNMGAAMAPACADTILRHLSDFDRKPDYYDAIFTGDLGRHGKELLEYILSKEGITLPDTYMDTGASYFKPEQQTFQGGSGAGCISTVFNGYVLNKLENGALGKILVVPTGALLNKDTPLQKETIPGISHAFVVETEKIKEKCSKNHQNRE